MRQTQKRITSVLLALALLITLIPLGFGNVGQMQAKADAKYTLHFTGYSYMEFIDSYHYTYIYNINDKVYGIEVAAASGVDMSQTVNSDDDVVYISDDIENYWIKTTDLETDTNYGGDVESDYTHNGVRIGNTNEVTLTIDSARHPFDRYDDNVSLSGIGSSAEISLVQAVSGEYPKEAKIKVGVKNKTLKAKALKKKAQKFSLKIKTSSGDWEVWYGECYDKKSKKALKISDNGIMTVKKGTKKGTYKMEVCIRSYANTNYYEKYDNFIITVKVK